MIRHVVMIGWAVRLVDGSFRDLRDVAKYPDPPIWTGTRADADFLAAAFRRQGAEVYRVDPRPGERANDADDETCIPETYE